MQAASTYKSSTDHLSNGLGKILVLIVTYKGTPWLEGCLSPFERDREGLDILVVDNASPDGTAEKIRAYYPFVEVWKRPTNLGFGRANNLGLEKALAEDYRGVFLLNQDATVEASTIRELATRTEANDSIGIASPVHYHNLNQDKIEKGFSHYLGDQTPIDKNASEPLEVSFINAALWYVPRRTLITTGLFCPLFVHYGEDLDYVRRVQFSGKKVVFFPDLSGCHFRSESPISKEKQDHLNYAYHLSCLIDPNRSAVERLLDGLLKPTIEGVLDRDLSTLRQTKELIRLRPTAHLWLERPPLSLADLKRCYARKVYAPVLLLVYNRPLHTKRLLTDFFENPESVWTPLYIVQDGGSGVAWEEVGRLGQDTADRFPLVTFIQRNENIGLANNVTRSVTKLLKEYDSLIVLEDDLELSHYFLRWMNDALECYKDNREVAHLHAGTFYYKRGLRHNHFLGFVGSWGWATWWDRWESLWNPDGEKLLREIESRPDIKAHFDYGGFQRFSRMLWKQTKGLNNSWAVRWHASVLLHGKLSVNSSPPLVNNRGFDGSGTHSSADDRYRVPISPYPLYAETKPGKEEREAYQTLRTYYMIWNNKVVKGYFKLKELWGKFFR